MDANGIFHASAINTSTGRQNGMTIEMDKGLLAKEEIQRLVKEAEKYKAEDEAHRERISAMNQLESLCADLSKKLEDLKIRSKTTEGERKKLRGLCGDILRWAADNRFAEKEEYQQRQKEVETAWKPLEDTVRA